MRRMAAVLATCATLGAGAAENDSRWYVQVDNDLVFDTDRWYSSGLRGGRVDGSGDLQVEWGLLHEIYSPEGKYWFPGVDDRVPTARLLFYGARHRFTRSYFETIELAAGVRGPAARGKQLTDMVHKFVDAAKVEWSRQEGRIGMFRSFAQGLEAARTLAHLIHDDPQHAALAV